MGPAVYILGALTSLVCAILLARGYVRSQAKLLLWSALCFFGLTISNALIFVDLVLFPEKDLYLWRLTTATASMLVLVYGLIWEGEK